MDCKVFCAVLQVNTSYLIQQCIFFYLYNGKYVHLVGFPVNFNFANALHDK